MNITVDFNIKRYKTALSKSPHRHRVGACLIRLSRLRAQPQEGARRTDQEVVLYYHNSNGLRLYYHERGAAAPHFCEVVNPCQQFAQNKNYGRFSNCSTRREVEIHSHFSEHESQLGRG